MEEDAFEDVNERDADAGGEGVVLWLLGRVKNVWDDGCLTGYHTKKPFARCLEECGGSGISVGTGA